MKILIIEDESSIAENISYALSTEGHESLWCETGKDALERLASDDIGFIILDVGLPDMNGFDLMREIRKKSATPVLFLTARASEIDRVVGPGTRRRRLYDETLQSPGTGCPGPGDPPAHFPLDREPAPSCDRRGDPFRMDEKRCAVFYHGQDLELSRYEYRVLKVLVEHPRPGVFAAAADGPGMGRSGHEPGTDHRHPYQDHPP